MAQIKRLTVREVDTKPEGFHGDGANLYLHVRKPTDAQRQIGNLAGSRAWVFRYKVAGKDVNIGLGGTASRSLKQARELAGQMRSAIADGRDPKTVLRARRDPTAKTFEAYALALIETKKGGWKDAGKTAAQWKASLSQHVFPIVGNKLPREITLADVKAILTPLWTSRTEMGSKVRSRIEAVLNCAAVDEDDLARANPARWKGVLQNIGFPTPHKVTPPIHHAAAEYKDVPAIMAALREKDSTSANCLRWAILTATRSGESRGAKWSELKEPESMWEIPASRMKASRKHHVALCDEALEILASMKKRKVVDCDFIFPGAKGNKLWDVSVNKTLHAIDDTITVHGFRSSFKTWGTETRQDRDILELCLAHLNPNKVEAAYQRSELIELRRNVMMAWANYCAAKNNVVQLAHTA